MEAYRLKLVTDISFSQPETNSCCKISWNYCVFHVTFCEQYSIDVFIHTCMAATNIKTHCLI